MRYYVRLKSPIEASRGGIPHSDHRPGNRVRHDPVTLRAGDLARSECDHRGDLSATRPDQCPLIHLSTIAERAHGGVRSYRRKRYPGLDTPAARIRDPGPGHVR